MKAQTADTRKIKKVMLTRSKEGNAELAQKLSALGIQPISIETMSFLPPEDWAQIDASLMNLSSFDWVALTSAVGAKSFLRRMSELSLRVPWEGKPAVAAVGEKTRDALVEKGVSVDFVPSEYLTKKLASEMPLDRGKKLLVLRADVADPDMVPTLESAGFEVEEHVIYRTSTVAGGQKVTRHQLEEADAVIFGSPSAVEGLVARLEANDRESLAARQLLAVCIGPVTARAAKEHGFKRISTPSSYTFDSLLETLSSEALGEGS